MGRVISRAWRILRSGASFALFGLGGVFLAVFMVPLVRLLSRSKQQREFRCQYMVQHCFRFFIRFMEVLRLIRVDVRGAELLRQPGQLVLANHPTLLDVVYLVSLMPQVDCVVKRAILSNPFMRGVASATGYLPNDEGEAMVEACVERLRAGRTVLLFPEGTRSPMGELGRFRRGAAHVALTSGRSIRPVVITCDPPALMRGQSWYDVADRRLRVTVECCENLDPAKIVGEGGSRGVAARKLSATLRDFYAKKLQNCVFRGVPCRPGTRSISG